MQNRKGPGPLLIGSFILILIASCTGSESLPIDNPTETTQKISVTHNLPYAKITMPEEKEQLLDVYQPLQEGTWPVVLLLHGHQGTKEGYIDVSQAIAEQGVVVFTISWPTWLIDMAVRENGKGFREMHEVLSCAAHFAHATASKYHGDSERLILVGHSYGASNGALIALSRGHLGELWEEYSAVYGGPATQVECVGNSSFVNIDAFIGIAGPFDKIDKLKGTNPDLWEIVSPYGFVDQEDYLPIRLIHGEEDVTVPPEVSVQFNDLLQKAGYDSKLILHDGGHRVPVEITISEILSVIELISE